MATAQRAENEGRVHWLLLIFSRGGRQLMLFWPALVWMASNALSSSLQRSPNTCFH